MPNLGENTGSVLSDNQQHIIEKDPFCIREIRTDHGYEFRAKVYWHVEDLGIHHSYIKRGTPQLNGKVERSHRSDGQEFYQFLIHKGDVDLEAKLDEWERFYNFHRPHGAHNGRTPDEALGAKLQSNRKMSRRKPHLTAQGPSRAQFSRKGGRVTSLRHLGLPKSG